MLSFLNKINSKKNNKKLASNENLSTANSNSICSMNASTYDNSMVLASNNINNNTINSNNNGLGIFSGYFTTGRNYSKNHKKRCSLNLGIWHFYHIKKNQ